MASGRQTFSPDLYSKEPAKKFSAFSGGNQLSVLNMYS